MLTRNTIRQHTIRLKTIYYNTIALTSYLDESESFELAPNRRRDTRILYWSEKIYSLISGLGVICIRHQHFFFIPLPVMLVLEIKIFLLHFLKNPIFFMFALFSSLVTLFVILTHLHLHFLNLFHEKIISFHTHPSFC